MNLVQALEKLFAHRRFMNNDPTGERADFTGEDLSGLNLSNNIISGAIFTNAVLNGTNLSHTLATNAIFTGASLVGANLSDGMFAASNFDSANLTNANLADASFDDASFMGSTFANTELRGASFTVSKMSFPIYTFYVEEIPVVATPSELRLDDEVHPWNYWTTAALEAFFLQANKEPKNLSRHVLKVDFFRQLLIERGYTL